ncbi:hypothetical protein BC834DRAFT_103640 [Gloeopeniophorella convolvens]|nr:hypothetical protein BC834DRAFT_103640 [Gloeopeniophorella convolvens]
MQHHQYSLAPTSENKTVQAAAMVPYINYSPLPSTSAMSQVAGPTTHGLDNHHPSHPTSRTSTAMHPYYDPYASPHSPLPHATSIPRFHPFLSLPIPEPHVSPMHLHNSYLPRTLPPSCPSYYPLSLPTVPSQRGAKPPLSIERAPELHGTMEETFDHYLRYYLKPVLRKPVLIGWGLRPVKRLRTNGPFPDQLLAYPRSIVMCCLRSSTGISSKKWNGMVIAPCSCPGRSCTFAEHGGTSSSDF